MRLRQPSPRPRRRQHRQPRLFRTAASTLHAMLIAANGLTHSSTSAPVDMLLIGNVCLRYIASVPGDLTNGRNLGVSLKSRTSRIGHNMTFPAHSLVSAFHPNRTLAGRLRQGPVDGRAANLELLGDGSKADISETAEQVSA